MLSTSETVASRQELTPSLVVADHELALQSETLNTEPNEVLQNEVVPQAPHVDSIIESALEMPLNETVIIDPDENDAKHLLSLATRQKELHAQLTDHEKLPKSYWSNSPAEELAIKYANSFCQQYSVLYPYRMPLFLTTENEFKIMKITCTYIRPTQLGHRELYDYRSCAQFVADFISYEPLDPPFQLPAFMNSSTYSLAMQKGNCFDISVILVSLLRGVGYDAYVVSGYASRNITLMDDTHINVDPVKLLNDAKFGGNDSDCTTKNEIKPDLHEIILAAMNKANNSVIEPNIPGQSELKYSVKYKGSSKSRYLNNMEALHLQKEKEKQNSVHQDNANQQLVPQNEDDEIAGLRVHAWVLVMAGKRDISEAFFIESSTGKIYDLDNENYLGVESVFNSTNHWVNMQKCATGLQDISFDLSDTTKWEFIFAQNVQAGIVSQNDSRDAGDKSTSNTDEEGKEDPGKIETYDLPLSWVSKINISREQFESQCPTGTKVQMWQNGKQEIFAAYHRADGMVTRVTLFEDINRSECGSIYERFENRADKLWKRVRVPGQGLVCEYFLRSRTHSLMEHLTENGRTIRMRFYAGVRSDGLFDRLEHGNKTVELFDGRSDLLVYRSVTYETICEPDEEPSSLTGSSATNANTQSVTIVKMAEKFARKSRYAPSYFPFSAAATPLKRPDAKNISTKMNMGQSLTSSDDARELLPSGHNESTVASPLFGNNDIAKRVYNVRDETIRIVYHTEPFVLIPSWCEFRKPSNDHKTSFSELTTSFYTTPPLHPIKRQYLYANLCELLKAEHACLQSVKASDREMKDILQDRYNEEKDIQLEVSPFDTIRAKMNITEEIESGPKKITDELFTAASLDYLSPFLLNSVYPNNPTKEEATLARESCLRSYKDRMVEKASIMQRRFDEETALYQKRQLHYSKNADSMAPNEVEEYVAFCNDALLRIRVLEKRIASHKESAPEQYRDLDQKLRSDPRLAKFAL